MQYIIIYKGPYNKAIYTYMNTKCPNVTIKHRFKLNILNVILLQKYLFYISLEFLGSLHVVISEYDMERPKKCVRNTS